MKKTRLWVSAILAAALVFSLPSCKSDDDDDDDDETSSSTSTTYATLPTSSGTNELSGKTGKTTSSYDDWSETKTWTFSDSTVTYTEVETEDGETSTETKTYNYSYDSSNKLLYLGLKSYSYKDSDTDVSYSSVAEAESLMKKAGLSGTELEYEVAREAADFASRKVYQYTISYSSLTLKEYFDGSFPIDFDFYKWDSSSELYIDYDRNRIEISSDSDKDIEYKIVPTFSSGSFSGTVYKEDYDNDAITSLGTATATYTSSGTGTSGVTMTITFNR